MNGIVGGSSTDSGIPVTPITEEEYAVLSDEQKNSETAWLVTDAEAEGSDGSGSSPGGTEVGNVYSAEEVRIGTWIDGKPLYRRVFERTTPSDNSRIRPFSPSIIIENGEIKK